MQVETMFFRRGEVSDLPAVEELCKDVWDGHDYIPSVWQDWLNNPLNLVFVLELDGQLAALYCLKLQMSETDKAGWWQGVRVATRHKRHGLAGRLLEHVIAESRAHGLTSLRYATAVPNAPMHRLAQKHNFRCISPYSFALAPRLEGNYVEETAFQSKALQASDFEAAWAFIQTSSDWEKGEGIHCDAWVWTKLEAELLRQWLEKGWVYGCFKSDKLAALALTRHENEPDNSWLFVTWLDGTLAAIGVLIRYLWAEATAKAAEKQQNVLDIMTIQEDERDELFHSLGFVFEPGEQMRLYEFRLNS